MAIESRCPSELDLQMTISFSIPTLTGPKDIQVEQGTSVYFLGANGGGKTRLAVNIEEQVGERCHRISAHRALILNPEVAKISQKAALGQLRFGTTFEGAHVGHRIGSRWQSKAATALLSDYDSLVQAMFAEQSITALETHNNVRSGKGEPAKQTRFEKLVEIWDRLLPHRKLHVSGDNITVTAAGSNSHYPAPEMSDGERAVFYLIGQTLMAAEDSLIIFDEPELHIHRSIVAGLWDELEALRQNCSMVVISHDLEFIASRKGQKFVLRAYDPNGGWTVEDVPEESGFSEEVTTLILGSRRPVLFVEGGNSSLDKAIFRACYPDWTVIPRGSCEEVLHAVVTMRANAALTRVSCAGIVDADAYTQEEAEAFRNRGVEILPVSEIENLFLLPDVVKAIAKSEGYNEAEVAQRAAQVQSDLFAHAAEQNNQHGIVMRYCRRRIDRTLKKVDLSVAPDVLTLASTYAAKTGSLDVQALATLASKAIQDAIAAQDAAELLRWYDNKGILAFTARVKNVTKDKFEQWVVRVMRSGTVPELTAAIRAKLPTPVAA